LAGRLYFARVDGIPAAAPLKLPATPRHAALAQVGAGDFLFLIGSDAVDAGQRAVNAEIEFSGPPARSGETHEFSGRIRLLQPPRRLPLATAQRFLHDGTNGPADFPGESDGEKIDAALLYSGCFMDPKIKGSVPKIAHFWRWLGGGER
jgi:hypothetical protein